jgi:hypothetical protein
VFCGPTNRTRRKNKQRERVLLAAGPPASSRPRCHRIARRRHLHRHKSPVEQILPKLPSSLVPLSHGRSFSQPQPKTKFLLSPSRPEETGSSWKKKMKRGRHQHKSERRPQDRRKQGPPEKRSRSDLSSAKYAHAVFFGLSEITCS